MTLKCCIIDDEPLARDLIKSYVEKTPFLELIGAYESATYAIKTLISGNLDVVFLDINMPCVNGIELAEVIPSECRIIYITAYEQYAIQGFKANALDYLLKPVSYPEFIKAVNKAAQWTAMHKALVEKSGNKSDYIIVKSDYKLMQICLSDIQYVEGQKDYVKIYIDKEPFMITSLMNLKTLEHRLPQQRFMRVHRSFIVNMSKIKMIERNRIVFGKVYIPISETYKDSFTNYLQSHLVTANQDSSAENKAE